ncbi:MAG: baseplate assembly protein [Exiguobacterium chiriqhucha]|uniref:phage baseplate assembly protein V n=1 Tax=Exiguobacterium chiriqhucha TaxID=1385984 RepID=UPI00144DC9C2|nr:phage baseplate assembly protein V [Exiguobacterium chiriqhucha]KAB2864651.1 MAG: baseplate assembly protein [Exiguobacterium chiriqhucha]
MRHVDIGRVSSIYPERATVRVLFEDKGGEEVVSRELPIVGRGSVGVKDYWLPKIDEMVVCIFVEGSAKQGYVLGSIFNEIDNVPVIEATKRHVEFEDGAYVQYDTKTKNMTIQLVGDGTMDVKGRIIADQFTTRNGGTS